MSRQERYAWLNLTILGLAIVVFLALLPVLGAQRAIGAFGLLGLLGIIPIFDLAARATHPVVASDERDQLIQARAWLIAYSAFWVVFVGGSMALWALNREPGWVSVNVLPLFPLAGWIVLTLAHSVATLIQYARGR